MAKNEPYRDILGLPVPPNNWSIVEVLGCVVLIGMISMALAPIAGLLAWCIIALSGGL